MVGITFCNRKVALVTLRMSDPISHACLPICRMRESICREIESVLCHLVSLIILLSHDLAIFRAAATESREHENRPNAQFDGLSSGREPPLLRLQEWPHSVHEPELIPSIFLGLATPEVTAVEAY